MGGAEDADSDLTFRGYSSDVTDASLIATDEFTAEAWVRNVTPDSGGRATVFTVHTSDAVAGAPTSFNELVQLQFDEEFSTGDLRLRLLYFESAGAEQVFSDVLPPLLPDVWYHVAVTYEGNTPGVDDGAANGDVLMGYTLLGSKRAVGGEIDEFRYSSVERPEFELVFPAPPVPALGRIATGALLLALAGIGLGLGRRLRVA